VRNKYKGSQSPYARTDMGSIYFKSSMKNSKDEGDNFAAEVE
jgi:hypothetical protein